MSEKKPKKKASQNKKLKKVNWEKLENEYISTKISYKNLAFKYKIAERQVEKYGSEHNWVQKRREFVGEVSGNVKKALIQNETDSQLKKLEALTDAADKLSDIIHTALCDEKQLYRRSFYSVEKGEVIEYETKKIDTAALSQIAKALEKTADVIRDLNGIVREEKKTKIEATLILPKGAENFGN